MAHVSAAAAPDSESDNLDRSDVEPDTAAIAAPATPTPGSEGFIPPLATPAAKSFMEADPTMDDDAAAAAAAAAASPLPVPATVTGVAAAAGAADEKEKGGKSGDEKPEPKHDEAEEDFNVLRLIDAGEEVLAKFGCARVSLMDKCDGVLLLGAPPPT